MDIKALKTNSLFNYAAKDESAIRKKEEANLSLDYRYPYSIDADRIINSRAYARYIDKTQVFSLIENDHITHRVLHVQLVSKIGRTIGRFLSLNEDLIESIALGHDIGHAPFGHDGEKILSDICECYGIGPYKHNVQSVHFLSNVEKKGLGLNLTLQTLDGILTHNGETHDTVIGISENKDFCDLDKMTEGLNEGLPGKYEPMTLEACVVRFSDTVSYIGKDIEDAIILGIIKREDLPKESVEILGNTNGKIVYNLVTDIIENSLNKKHIAYSQQYSDALRRLKEFNLERIYMNKKLKSHMKIVEEYYQIIFDRYFNDIKNSNKNSKIFKDFLHDKSEKYRDKYSDAQIVRDFIGGMTDLYFINQISENVRPSKIRF